MPRATRVLSTTEGAATFAATKVGSGITVEASRVVEGEPAERDTLRVQPPSGVTITPGTYATNSGSGSWQLLL